MKSLFEQMGDIYTWQGDYYLPNLKLPVEKEMKSIGIWGLRHKRCLQEHRIATYTTLLTSGKLKCYLADIDKQAENLFLRFVEQMPEREGVTKHLKASNQIAWVRTMNNICSRAS